MNEARLNNSSSDVEGVMHFRLFCAAYALAAALPISAFGLDAKVGQRVYTKPEAKAKVDNRIVDFEMIPFPGKVEKIEGDWLWLGQLRIHKTDALDADEAITYFTEAIKNAPTDSYPYLYRALVWHNEGKYANAVDDNTSALKLNPMDITALCNRANALGRMKDFKSAIADYSEVIRLDPTHAHSFNNRGMSFEFIKEYDKAIQDFTEIIRLTPKSPVPYDNLAWLRATCPDERYRNGVDAVEMATKCANITEWKSARCLDTLAAAYAESGEFAKAIEWQENAIDLTSSDAEKSRYRTRLKLYQTGKPFHEGLLAK